MGACCSLLFSLGAKYVLCLVECQNLQQRGQQIMFELYSTTYRSTTLSLNAGLKALFRPMTVMVPDLVLICENMLMAEGFIEAKVQPSFDTSLWFRLTMYIVTRSI